MDSGTTGTVEREQKGRICRVKSMESGQEETAERIHCHSYLVDFENHIVDHAVPM